MKHFRIPISHNSMQLSFNFFEIIRAFILQKNFLWNLRYADVQDFYHRQTPKGKKFIDV